MCSLSRPSSMIGSIHRRHLIDRDSAWTVTRSCSRKASGIVRARSKRSDLSRCEASKRARCSAAARPSCVPPLAWLADPMGAVMVKRPGSEAELAREATRTDNASWFDRFADRARVESGNEIATVLSLASRSDVISFSGGFPDPQSLDRVAVAEIVAELSSGVDTLPFEYGPTGGVASFRNYVGERLGTLEQRRVGEDELLITSGGIEAIRLAATVFLDPGDVVIVEAPTYMGARLSFTSSGARLDAVPLDGDGMDVAILAQQLAAGLRPKLVYTNPDHQNPAGVTQTRERRDALVDLAALYGFLIVEDVAYREFTFAAE